MTIISAITPNAIKKSLTIKSKYNRIGILTILFSRNTN